jgi:hypothetical protein
MKEKVPDELERGRITFGPYQSNATYGWNGVFEIRNPYGSKMLMIISDGGDWEHVSTEVLPEPKNMPQRMPTWDEMCWVKDMCWKPSETVVQYHPAKENYVNIATKVLHLWRPTKKSLPLPPLNFV